MLAAVRFPVLALVFVASGRCSDVCPHAAVEKSGGADDLTWTSSVRRISAEKFCTEHHVTNLRADRPMPVAWPAAGVLEAKIGGDFVIAFCCSEDVAIQRGSLQYDGPAQKSIETHVHVGLLEENDDYPDLIEPDAKIKQFRFAGRLWDGTQFVKVDLELRVSASYPHFKQSVFEFAIADQSPERLQVDWNLLQEMKGKMKPFFTETPGAGYHRSTWVFFGKERPTPRNGVVTLRTAAGKLLGRFVAEGFTP